MSQSIGLGCTISEHRVARASACPATNMPPSAPTSWRRLVQPGIGLVASSTLASANARNKVYRPVSARITQASITSTRSTQRRRGQWVDARAKASIPVEVKSIAGSTLGRTWRRRGCQCPRGSPPRWARSPPPHEHIAATGEASGQDRDLVLGAAGGGFHQPRLSRPPTASSPPRHQHPGAGMHCSCGARLVGSSEGGPPTGAPSTCSKRPA